MSDMGDIMWKCHNMTYKVGLIKTTNGSFSDPVAAFIKPTCLPCRETTFLSWITKGHLQFPNVFTAAIPVL